VKKEISPLACDVTSAFILVVQCGLLKPSAYAESGQRLYSESDYAKLQQILTLKRIDLRRLLARQRQILCQRVRQLMEVIHATDAVGGTHGLDYLVQKTGGKGLQAARWDSLIEEAAYLYFGSALHLKDSEAWAKSVQNAAEFIQHARLTPANG
jgi:DNA-binding transcriptional MerR regulator